MPEGQYVLLEAALPDRPARKIGVFLVDPATGRGWMRLRRQYDDIADPDDAEVLEALESDMRSRLAESGGSVYLERLEDSLSNTIRLGERHTVQADAFTRTLDRLYADHVESAAVIPFQTHVPLYSLRAAAGKLGEEMVVEPEDWVRLPEDVRASPDLFVAHVVGDSMEPRIPNGSLNLFRFHPAGSRQGKFLLIQRYGAIDESARFTVKRYTSRKVYHDDGQWEHEQIRLEPLNPAHQPWDVEPQDFAVVAEWLRVIE